MMATYVICLSDASSKIKSCQVWFNLAVEVKWINTLKILQVNSNSCFLFEFLHFLISNRNHSATNKLQWCKGHASYFVFNLKIITIQYILKETFYIYLSTFFLFLIVIDTTFKKFILHHFIKIFLKQYYSFYSDQNIQSYLWILRINDWINFSDIWANK